MIEQLRSALAGRYAVERQIGAGGMATVYLAHDLRHDRKVALKLLNPDLGAVVGVERFLSEIRVTAKLQHPNVLPLFDSGEADGHLFYVMPYVDGETLRALLEREKQLPISEAIRIAVAIANALEYAHGHEVIHRDLKPENILLQSGQPVIADFGIALAVSQAGGNRITQTGLSLGTPQYMSPEQATGDRVIDRRSDIYSLAAMTYEMLAGEPPHTGTTSQAIIARLLTERQRSVRLSRPAVPEHVDEALARGLEKLPADRYSSAREFAEALQGRGDTGHTRSVGRSATVARPRHKDPAFLSLAAVALIAVAAVTFVPGSPDLPRRAVRFAYSGSDSTLPAGNYPWPAAISPDGSTIVYSSIVGSTTALFLLRTNELDPRRIPGTEDAYQAIFSPDGQWIAFQQRGQTKKLRLDALSSITITAAGGANGMDWSPRDEMFFGAEGRLHGLSKASTNGGDLKAVTTPDTTRGIEEHLWPIVSPNGKRVYFVIWTGAQPSARLASVSADGGDVSELAVKGLRTLAVVDRTLIYVDHSGVVMALPLSRGGESANGSPVPVHDKVPVVPILNGNSEIFVSRGGALVTSAGTVTTRLTWLSPGGRQTSVTPAVQAYSGATLSPDQSQIAMAISDQSNRSDIWIFDRPTGTFSRLTTGRNAFSPRWLADGRRLVYVAGTDSMRSGVWEEPANGSAPPKRLFQIPSLVVGILATPDGKTVLYSAYINTSWGIYAVEVDSTGSGRRLIDTPAHELSNAFSPDGRWLTYTSDETGSFEVYARSFPDLTARIQISQGGGTEGAWSRDGARVYYRQGNALMAARLAATPSLRVVGRDTILSRVPIIAQQISTGYDVMQDGTILGLVPNRADYRLVVVPDWKPELRERIASGSRR